MLYIKTKRSEKMLLKKINIEICAIFTTNLLSLSFLNNFIMQTYIRLTHFN